MKDWLIQTLLEAAWLCIVCIAVTFAICVLNPSSRDLAGVQLGFTVCAVTLLLEQRRGA
jgi:hypothetical protein